MKHYLSEFPEYCYATVPQLEYFLKDEIECMLELEKTNFILSEEEVEYSRKKIATLKWLLTEDETETH